MCQCQFSTVTDLQREMGCCSKSLTTGMVAGNSPTSCPTGDCVLILPDWTSHTCKYHLISHISANEYPWFHAGRCFSLVVLSSRKDLPRWKNNIDV